jgi:tetratricopeptide (TPR) repeat protein
MNTDLALIERALAEAREALALDSACVRALYCIAVCQTSILSLDGVAGPDAGRRWQEGVKAAGRLIELDPSGSVGYAWMGVLQSMARRSVEALSYARRAREINCNDAAALVQLALVELWGGQPELALEHANQAIRLNPRDPRHYSTNAIRAGACFLLRRHVEGQEYAIQSAAAAPNYPFAHLMRALTAVGIGDIPMAKAAMDTARRLSPDLLRGRLEGESPYHHVDGASPTTLAWRIAAGLEDPGAAASLR